MQLQSLRISQPIGKALIAGVIIAAAVVAAVWVSSLTVDKPKTNVIGKPSIANNSPQALTKFSDYGLTIEKLNISAPIIPNVSFVDDKVYLKAIQKGVALGTDSSNPDKAGNMFIFGHSEYYKNAPGDYKEVFKHLDQLQENDEFVIDYKNTPYRYRVNKSYVTSNTDWEIIKSKDSKSKTVTLMTCWPPGTTDKRWVVRATQI